MDRVTRTNVNKKEVGERIAEIIDGLDMTKKAFAEEMGVIRGSVTNWCRGVDLPTNPKLKKIAKLGGLSVDELLYGPDGYQPKSLNAVQVKFQTFKDLKDESELKEVPMNDLVDQYLRDGMENKNMVIMLKNLDAIYDYIYRETDSEEYLFLQQQIIKRGTAQ